MRAAMQHAGLCVDDIAALQRNPADYLGFVEVHIEQGPVLNEMDLPLGIVTSINGSVRYLCEVIGMASHAGTTPMDRRRDAAVAVAPSWHCTWNSAPHAGRDSVGTIGILQVPNGSINVVPGAASSRWTCAPPPTRSATRWWRRAAELAAICERRQLHHTLEETMRAAAAPSAPAWQAALGTGGRALGVPLHRMPSGAGHDAMKLHEVMPQAMLFVRGQNAGISHNPLESTTSDDMQLAVDAFSSCSTGCDRI
jgi:N-carbamoyl-L-amino-acid hydrolase